MVRKNVIKKNSTEDRSSDEKKPKKAKFLTKFHKEQHDNIFSKKFKQNKLSRKSK